MSKIMRQLVQEAKAARAAQEAEKKTKEHRPDCPYSGQKCEKPTPCGGICADSYPPPVVDYP